MTNPNYRDYPSSNLPRITATNYTDYHPLQLRSHNVHAKLSRISQWFAYSILLYTHRYCSNNRKQMFLNLFRVHWLMSSAASVNRLTSSATSVHRLTSSATSIHQLMFNLASVLVIEPEPRGFDQGCFNGCHSVAPDVHRKYKY